MCYWILTDTSNWQTLECVRNRWSRVWQQTHFAAPQIILPRRWENCSFISRPWYMVRHCTQCGNCTVCQLSGIVVCNIAEVEADYYSATLQATIPWVTHWLQQFIVCNVASIVAPCVRAIQKFLNTAYSLLYILFLLHFCAWGFQGYCMCSIRLHRSSQP